MDIDKAKAERSLWEQVEAEADKGHTSTWQSFLQPSFRKKRWIILPLLILCAVVLASCGGPSLVPANPARSIRPVTKIGLIAPFEGLYRRSGYEALTAMRAALASHADLIQSTGIDILPLALDDSGHPPNAARTAQKLVADPTVAAVIGPISPSTARAAAATLVDQTRVTQTRMDQTRVDQKLVWMPPYLAGQTEDVWLRQLLMAVNRSAKEQGAERLIAVSQNQVWSQLAISALQADMVLPTEFVVQLRAEALQATDAVFFLGPPAEAANTVSQLRQHHESIPFWMGPQGGDPVFFERAARIDGVYWATWLDDGYDAWRTRHEPSTPAAYQVYRATVAAIYAIVDPAGRQAASESTVRFFRIEPNGVSITFEP